MAESVSLNPRLTRQSSQRHTYQRVSTAPPTSEISSKLQAYMKPDNYLAIEREYNQALNVDPYERYIQPHSQPHFKYSWYILLTYFLAHFFASLLCLIMRIIAIQLDAGKPDPLCTVNMSQLFQAQYLFFSVGIFPPLYTFKLIKRAGEEPYIFSKKRINQSNDMMNPNALLRHKYYYLYSTKELKTKIVLSMVDVAQTLLSIFVLIVYFGASQREACFQNNPMLWVLVPSVTILTQICSIVRVSLMWYYFVYYQKKALTIQETNQVVNKIRYQFPMLQLKTYNKQFEAATNKIDVESMPKLSEEPSCPICCDIMNPVDYVVYLPCNISHMYHSRCIQLWLGKNDSCPLCKTKVIENEESEGNAGEPLLNYAQNI